MAGICFTVTHSLDFADEIQFSSNRFVRFSWGVREEDTSSIIKGTRTWFIGRRRFVKRIHHSQQVKIESKHGSEPETWEECKMKWFFSTALFAQQDPYLPRFGFWKLNMKACCGGKIGKSGQQVKWCEISWKQSHNCCLFSWLDLNSVHLIEHSNVFDVTCFASTLPLLIQSLPGHVLFVPTVRPHVDPIRSATRAPPLHLKDST